ncbi:hypothetical protein BJV77DRAFT_385221 [Russula vinacea]|nr:hypothetical protein BJV77DRAFT_385221 [Russula vinacea]
MAASLIISGFRAGRHLRCPSPYYRLSSLLRVSYTSHPSHLSLHRYRKMVETARRRIHENSADKGTSPNGAVGERERHDHELSNTHSHSHGIFGGHSHGHDHDKHSGGLIETLQSGGAHPSRHPPLVCRTLPIHILNGLPFSFIRPLVSCR